jgi:hypothetical protein
MLLTQTELDLLRDRLPDETNPTDNQLQTAFDGLGDVAQVALRFLRRRLALLVAQPAQFGVPGEYSQNTGANITALREMIADIEANGLSPSVGGLLEVSQLVRPDAERGRPDEFCEPWPR